MLQPYAMSMATTNPLEDAEPAETEPAGKRDASGETPAEETLLRNAEPHGGEEVPLPPVT